MRIKITKNVTVQTKLGVFDLEVTQRKPGEFYVIFRSRGSSWQQNTRSYYLGHILVGNVSVAARSNAAHRPQEAVLELRIRGGEEKCPQAFEWLVDQAFTVNGFIHWGKRRKTNSGGGDEW